MWVYYHIYAVCSYYSIRNRDCPSISCSWTICWRILKPEHRVLPDAPSHQPHRGHLKRRSATVVQMPEEAADKAPFNRRSSWRYAHQHPSQVLLDAASIADLVGGIEQPMIGLQPLVTGSPTVNRQHRSRRERSCSARFSSRC